MEVNVTTNKVSITNSGIINKGELNVNIINFTFSEEYDLNFVKKAIFIDDNNIPYEKVISDNMCDLPSEILTNSGSITLGVYAYKTENERIIRYSPVPSRFKILNGSYSEETIPSEEITPSQFEQYNQALQNGLDKIDEALEKK